VTEKKPTDWERIELDYRAGIMTLREMGSLHSVSEGAIRKRAKRDNWSRDLNTKIKMRADELVRKEEVRKAVRSEAIVSEVRQVEIGAELLKEIKLGRRERVTKASTLTDKLIQELEFITDNRELFVKLGELMESPDDNGLDRLNDAYHKVIDLQGRIKMNKELSETMKTLFALEAQAFGLTEDTADESYEDRLARLMKGE
jgi:RNA polymerase-binding transcription factor DksA